MPTLFKPSRSPFWHFWYYDPTSGKQCQRSCKTTNKKQAKLYAVKALTDIAQQSNEAIYDNAVTLESSQPLLTPAPAPLLSEFIDDYLSLIGQRYTQKTVSTIADSFNQLRKRIGDKPLDAIGVEEAERFIWNGQPSVHSARKHYQHLRAAFAKAVAHGKITVNVFADFKKRKAPETSTDHLTPHDFACLLDGIPAHTYNGRRLRVMVILAFETGIRLGEVRFLEQSAVNLDGRQILVRNTAEFTVKSKRNRTVPLSEPAADALRSYWSEKTDHPSACVRESKYLFANPSGDPLSGDFVIHEFTRVSKKIFPDRRIHFHCLRHSFGTRLALAGVPLQMIQRLMGHSSVKVTERYTHTTNMTFDIALNVLNRATAPDTQTAHMMVIGLPSEYNAE